MTRFDTKCLTVALGLAVLGQAAAVAGDPDSTVLPVATAANACGNANTAPSVFGVEGVSPPTLELGGFAPANWDPRHARLERTGIHYVAGDHLKVNVVTDTCTSIAAVRLGSRELTTTNVEGYGYSTQPADPQPSDPARYAHALRIYFPFQNDGATETVTIVVARAGSGLTVQHAFPLVHVDAVEPSFAPAPIGFSDSELFNMFGKALYKKFNGAQNSTVLTSSDGSQRRIYGYNPNSLGLSVTSNGVAFQFKFKVDVDNWCDPTVRAYGTFKLDAGPANGITVDWVNPATGSANWGWCTALETIPILGLSIGIAYDVVGIEGQLSDGVLGAVQDAVLGSVGDVGGAQLFLTGSRTRTGELQVDLGLPAPSVTIQVPYDAFAQDRSATLFKRGERLMLLASGLGMSDFAAGVATSVRSGPNGLPLAGTTSWPNPRAVSRSEPLIWNAGPVAQLMVRNSMGIPLRERTYHYQAGCTVKPLGAAGLPGKGWIRFGVNDTASDAQRLRDIQARGYSVRVLFIDDAGEQIASAADYCGSSGTNILWRNAEGRTFEWLMEGAVAVADPQFGLIDPNWKIEGTGDFNGDRMGDILWRHTNGQVAIWYMDAGNRLGEGYPGGQDAGHFWTIQGTADFDGDGRSDILWRDANGQLAIWPAGDIAGALYPGYGNTPAPVELAWTVKGAGDFDGDGHADILWRHTNGQVAIWYMSGGERVGDSYPGGEDPGHSWEIHGVGDFDGNGSADILWRHVGGQLAIWFGGQMDGAAYPSYQNQGGPADQSWTVEGVGDFNEDGRADILWRHTSGQVGFWMMNGGTFLADVYSPHQVATTWQIQGLLRDAR